VAPGKDPVVIAGTREAVLPIEIIAGRQP
jgi:hypothetical protein